MLLLKDLENAIFEKNEMPQILIIGYVWPEPNSSAAGSRMMQLIEFFLNEKCKITFATTARQTENMTDLESMGIKTEAIQLNNSSFDNFLQKLKPEIVLFDRFMMEEQFGWRVDSICPEAIKILDTEDLHFLRKAREETFRKEKKEEDIYYDHDLTKREIASIYRCDLSLIISEVEMDLLLTKFQIPENILLYLPYLLEEIPSEEIRNLPGFEDRKDFITIGNFLHAPNWDAVLFLKEKIWKEIRKKLPDANLHIYGAYPSKKVTDLHQPEKGFLVHGWAEDSARVMREARICLAPIRFGAGLKGKLIEAMQNGTPSVTTPLGAEGINGNLPWNGFIDDSTDLFIQNSIALYSGKELWKDKQKNAFRILKERFDREKHFSNFQKMIHEIKDNLEKHRNLNFTGKMLKHHLHRSTYFMSRFIEEKNKNTK